MKLPDVTTFEMFVRRRATPLRCPCEACVVARHLVLSDRVPYGRACWVGPWCLSPVPTFGDSVGEWFD